ncbi:MAG TPA: MOSC domain-containing protein [Candidatus Baltobacteraceae bacterium]|nr:MOSC domain-containing protein [Candidatus Baltobacteraceae bacterium]
MHRSPSHHFSKETHDSIELVTGIGIAGDAHSGSTVRHRSRVKKDPAQPNLRQVHLLHAELFEELAAGGFSVRPGDLGENITTSAVDLLRLPRGTQLHLGAGAVVEITGLRNPCVQLDKFQQGLMSTLIVKGPDGCLVRKAGVMGIVISGGIVRAGDAIRVALPLEFEALEPV